MKVVCYVCRKEDDEDDEEEEEEDEEKRISGERTLTSRKRKKLTWGREVSLDVYRSVRLYDHLIC